MTVLLAVIEGGVIHLAADGVSSVHGGAHTMRTLPGGKFVVWSTPEPMAVGVCGANRVTQELRYRWSPPDVTAERATDRALAAVLDTLQSHLFAEDLKPLIVDGLEAEFLVAFRGRLFLVFNDLAFLERRSGFTALGSAMDVGMGALFASQGRPPRDRLTVALEACADVREEIRGPWEFVSLSPARTADSPIRDSVRSTRA